MMKTFIAMMLICFGARADYVGFSQGSEFASVAIEGQVTVSCNGFNGTGSAIYSCRDIVLDPQPYDSFIGPRDSRASYVELTSTQENGVRRSRGGDYEGSTGRSMDAYNLWISTLFQKPLLAVGNNRVDFLIYTSSRKTQLLSQGSFDVQVTRSGGRKCAPAHYNSTDINDCNSQYSICQRFFQEFHNCR